MVGGPESGLRGKGVAIVNDERQGHVDEDEEPETDLVIAFSTDSGPET